MAPTWTAVGAAWAGPGQAAAGPAGPVRPVQAADDRPEVPAAQPGQGLELADDPPGHLGVDGAHRGQRGRGQPDAVRMRPRAGQDRPLAQLGLRDQPQVGLGRLRAPRAHGLASQRSGRVTAAWLAGPRTRRSSDRASGWRAGPNSTSRSTWPASEVRAVFAGQVPAAPVVPRPPGEAIFQAGKRAGLPAPRHHPEGSGTGGRIQARDGEPGSVHLRQHRRHRGHPVRPVRRPAVVEHTLPRVRQPGGLGQGPQGRRERYAEPVGQGGQPAEGRGPGEASGGLEGPGHLGQARQRCGAGAVSVRHLAQHLLREGVQRAVGRTHAGGQAGPHARIRCDGIRCAWIRCAWIGRGGIRAGWIPHC